MLQGTDRGAAQPRFAVVLAAFATGVFGVAALATAGLAPDGLTTGVFGGVFDAAILAATGLAGVATAAMA
jgi:hypothetical protein